MDAPSVDIEIEEILDYSGRPKDEEGVVSKELVKDPLTEDQLKEALQYYRSSASGTRLLSAMMNRFRYIKGPHHIRQMLR